MIPVAAILLLLALCSVALDSNCSSTASSSCDLRVKWYTLDRKSNTCTYHIGSVCSKPAGGNVFNNCGACQAVVTGSVTKPAKCYDYGETFAPVPENCTETFLFRSDKNACVGTKLCLGNRLFSTKKECEKQCKDKVPAPRCD